MFFLMYLSKGVFKCVYITYILITQLQLILLLQERNRFVIESDQSFHKKKIKMAVLVVNSILRTKPTIMIIVPICSVFPLMPPLSRHHFPRSPHLRLSLLLFGEHEALQSSPVFSIWHSQQRCLLIFSLARPP